MKKRKRIIYDLVGISLTVGIVGVGIWLGFLQPRSASQRLSALKSDWSRKKAELRSVEEAKRRQSAELADLQKDIRSRGALPAQSPIEAELRTIDELARKNRMELDGVTPVTSKEYPGITELKYAVQGRSTFAGLLGFLRDFEQSTFWADVTRLKIGGRAGNRGEGNAFRPIEFEVNLFASRACATGETITR